MRPARFMAKLLKSDAANCLPAFLCGGADTHITSPHLTAGSKRATQQSFQAQESSSYCNDRLARHLHIRRFRYRRGRPRSRAEYRLGDNLHFREILAFDADLPGVDTPMRAGFEAALEALHILAGVSYYKVCAPPRLIVRDAFLDAAQRQFFQSLYVDGLERIRRSQQHRCRGQDRFSQRQLRDRAHKRAPRGDGFPAPPLRRSPRRRQGIPWSASKCCAPRANR